MSTSTDYINNSGQDQYWITFNQSKGTYRHSSISSNQCLATNDQYWTLEVFTTFDEMATRWHDLTGETITQEI